MKYIELTGRLLFSLIFINAVKTHLSGRGIDYAASKGVPFAEVLVPLSGVIAFAGGLSIASGFKTKLGAGLTVLFLVPVTIMMHNFWAVEESQRGLQLTMFMKNAAMIGGALMIIYHGAGPLSFDNRIVKNKLKETQLTNQ